MKPYQKAFISLALKYSVLRFGEFQLKSGRISPYFFNFGLFHDGAALAKLGSYYAQAISEAQIHFDQLFGPAYKGIPLVTSLALTYANQFNKNYPYSFDRKESKNHGEGGLFIGAPFKGSVLIVDDVITAGTAALHSIEIIQTFGAKVGGIAVALDRQEKGTQNMSAIEEIKKNYQIPIVSIITLQDVISYLKKDKTYPSHLESMLAYQQRYGIK